MKTENLPSKRKMLTTILFLFTSLMICYFYEYHKVYASINIAVSKTAVIEYGSPNYDIRTVVDSVDGDIVSIKKDIDTTNGLVKILTNPTLTKSNLFRIPNIYAPTNSINKVELKAINIITKIFIISPYKL